MNFADLLNPNRTEANYASRLLTDYQFIDEEYGMDALYTIVDEAKDNRVYLEETHEPCPKCGGSGYIDYYEHVEGGVCFHCGGIDTTVDHIVRNEFAPVVERLYGMGVPENDYVDKPEEAFEVIARDVDFIREHGGWYGVDDYLTGLLGALGDDE